MIATESSKVIGKLRADREELERRRERMLEVFQRAVKRRKSSAMRQVCRRMDDLNAEISRLDNLSEELRKRSDSREYVISSLFLHQCFKDLTADRFEQFFFITGCELDGRMFLDQKAEFEHSKRNSVAVVGEPRSTHKLLIKLEEFGHRLLAHFHSHPGNGLGMTFPSITDRNFQQRLESAGYPTVAAIFSRDGYIRFFRLDATVSIKIHGSGAEEVEPNVYRLTNIGNA